MIRKYLRFSLCDKCVYLITRRRNGERGEDLKAEEKSHYDSVREERQAYYFRRTLAHSCPDDYMSVIIDGADQRAYGAPHFVMRSKKTEGAYKLPMHLMGCIVHGSQVYGFTYLEHLRAGNNITIEVLHRVLVHQKKIRGGCLPPVLYVQLDNTASQCKGRYVLGYLALLVLWDIFEDVMLSFLPVGHTHEDIGAILFVFLYLFFAFSCFHY